MDVISAPRWYVSRSKALTENESRQLLDHTCILLGGHEDARRDQYQLLSCLCRWNFGAMWRQYQSIPYSRSIGRYGRKRKSKSTFLRVQLFQCGSLRARIFGTRVNAQAREMSYCRLYYLESRAMSKNKRENDGKAGFSTHKCCVLNEFWKMRISFGQAVFTDHWRK